MNVVFLSIVTFVVLASAASAQLPRIGSTISNDVKSYFGIARRIDNIDSMKVVKGAGLTILGIRRDVVVDSVTFTAEEVPILERYLRDYEVLLASEKDLFITDSSMRRILGRVSPRRFYDPTVKPISVRLANGTVKTGIPLAAGDDDILLSNELVFRPEVDIMSKNFSCIPASIIENITADVGAEHPRWYVVQGDAAQFRTAMRLSCPTRSYVAGLPPEAAACIPAIKDDLGDGAPLSRVCPRSKNTSFTGFGGAVTTNTAPVATVTRPLGTTAKRTDTLTVQQTTYSYGAEAAFPVSSPFDVGVRALFHIQPSTVDDLSIQNSLGFDSYSLHALGTWHILPIDVVGYNHVGISTTLGVGPAFLSYRGRTFQDSINLTTTGQGLALDVSWTLQVTVALSQRISIGARGFAMYQYGLSYSFDDITVEKRFTAPWVATFAIPKQDAAFIGGHLVVTYTLE